MVLKLKSSLGRWIRMLVVLFEMRHISFVSFRKKIIEFFGV